MSELELIFGIIFFITTIILCNIFFKARKDGRRFVKSLSNVLLFAVICTAANIVMLFPQERISYFGFSIFFASIDCLLLAFYEFSYRYTEVKQPKILMYIMHLITFADMVSLLISNITHHVFTLRTVTVNGSDYFRINDTLLYNLHLVLCYLLSIVIFANFVYKSLKASVFYRKKYIMITLGFLVVLVLDAGYMLTDIPVNASILAYAFGSIVVYYYTVVFVPSAIMDITLKRVVSDIPDAILVYDNDGNNLYINAMAKKLLPPGREKVESERILQTFHEKYPDVREEIPSIDQSFTDESGEHYYLVSYYPFIDQLGRYSGCFLRVEDHTQAVITARVEHYRATHDQLTGLYNKEYFAEKCKRTFRLHPYGSYILMVSDIDNFKIINDVFGMATGDKLLCHIADTIQEHAIQEIYCRVDNDRFGMLIPERLYNEAQLAGFVQEMGNYGKQDVFPITMHIGCYRVDDMNLSVSAMIDRCMLAIQSSKSDSTKLFTFYTDEMRKKLVDEQELLGELDIAVKNEEIIIYLQPQVDSNGTVLGSEALVRWNHSKRGLLFPGSFIPLFEAKGVITTLDIAVWEAACKTLATWKERGRTDLYISVNVSTRDMHFADVYSILTEMVERYDISPRNLKLEITETALMVNVEKQLLLMARLKNYGFTIEMDDFGSGYSSLNMLNQTKLDVLKIDMAFLRGTSNIMKSGEIIKTISSLAKVLGMECIMEGVETKEEFEYLRDIGITAFQGYYFAKPMPVADFEEKYMKEEEA